MGRHCAIDAPDAEALVEKAVAGIGAAVSALRVPGLRGVVLGGGYGRGEGGVLVRADGSRGLSNDLDFFAVARDGLGASGLSAIASALAPVAEEWKERLGVDVDFTVRTPRRLRRDERRLMVQELLRGHFDVAGEPGDRLFEGLAEIPASDVPWTEAVRQVANRGAGLLFAMDRGAPALFAARNVAKCVLGASDAKLVARGAYRWRARARAEADGSPAVLAALAWKSTPSETPPCSWEEARALMLDAAREVFETGRASGADRRSLREAARWVVRRRSIGPVRTFGRDCIVRLALQVRDCLEERRPLPPGTLEDWKIFN